MHLMRLYNLLLILVMEDLNIQHIGAELFLVNGIVVEKKLLKRYLTKTEVSNFLGICLKTVEKYCKDGLKFYLVGNNRLVRFKLVEVIQFMEPQQA